MAARVPPTKDAELVAFVQAFSAKIGATPAAFGLTPAIAASLAALVAAFVSAFDIASDPATRTKASIAAKDAARDALLATFRADARMIRATPSVTAAQLQALGLRVRDARPSRIPAPGVAPALAVVWAVGNTVRLRLADAASPASRGKPDGVAGAALFSFVGDAPPVNLADWSFQGNSTRVTFEVSLPAGTATGTRVWFCAQWVSPRLQSGPACSPVAAHIPGGVAQAA